MHLGGVGLPMTGPVRYTMTAEGAVELISALGPRVAVPMHYEGWSHFLQPEPAAHKVLGASAVSDRINWLTRGVTAQV